MTEAERYASPTAVEAAIAASARTAFTADPSLTVQERIRLECFQRFLSRVVSEPTNPRKTTLRTTATTNPVTAGQATSSKLAV